MSHSDSRLKVWFLVAASIFAMFASRSVLASPQESIESKKPYSMVTVEGADGDFFFQGEFFGKMKADSQETEVGLQIVASGNKNYIATQYVGGLPGNGWDGEATTKMVGKRTDNLLVLSGTNFAFLAKKDQILVVNGEGRRVGKLRRVMRSSPTMGAKPTKGSMVLFDGTDTDQFSAGEMTENGLLMQGADLNPLFQDFNLHVEFQLSFMPKNESQQRSNSGLYLQSRYELQVLDSFGLDPLFNGCGSLYRFRKPDINMCLPPLSWQTYDISFTSPRFLADGSKRKNARISVWHNGIKIHNNVKLTGPTGRGKPESPTLLPIRFQNHSDEVRYRNIWIVDRGIGKSKKFPNLEIANQQNSDREESGKRGKDQLTIAGPAKKTSAKKKTPTKKKR
jgi:hypothetical protein